MININCDGTERKQWPLHVNELLFEQGGWLYFVRRAGYNAILCKSRMDGSKLTVIAADIEKFIKVKNGYMYYINDAFALVKVRMDGSNLQRLCDDVADVLTVKEDKIVFVSVDDRIVRGIDQSITKTVKSIYAVDFSGGGKIKLAYDIKEAKEYDENTVYYIASQEIQVSYEENKLLDTLYRLDVRNYRVEKLVDLEMREAVGNSSGFAVAMAVMVMAMILCIIGFAAEAPGLGVIGLIAAIISLFVGVMIKSNNQ